MSSSDDSVDSEDESGEPSVKRRRTLNPLNADAALAMVKNACDNIKLGSRLEFFGPALVMLADALRESSQRNAGSARFQQASECAALEVLASLARSTNDNSFVSGFGVETKSLSQQDNGMNIDDDDEEEEEERGGFHILLSKIFQLKSTGHQKMKKELSEALVTTVISSETMRQHVQQLDADDPKLRALRQAFARMRRHISGGRYHKLRTGVGGVGLALKQLKIAPLNKIMPDLRSMKDAAQLLSPLEREAYNVVVSGEKSLARNAPCECYIPGRGFCPARILEVERDLPLGTFVSAKVRVWKSGLSEFEDINNIERKSIIVRQLQPANIDKGSCAWLPPDYMLKIVHQIGLWRDTVGRYRVALHLYDGSGMPRSERDNHVDDTIAGVVFLRGLYTDGSVYNFIIGMIATNKDSRMLFDAWIAEQMVRWRCIYATEEFREVTRLALLDFKAFWDATRAKPVTHKDDSCDDPLNNCKKMMGQLFDPERKQMAVLAVPNKTERSIQNVLANAQQATTYFNVDGLWTLPMTVAKCFHDPLHYGRFCCQFFGNLLLGFFAAGGEPLMNKYMRHLQRCCGVEFQNHYGITITAKGHVIITTRKGVGAVMRLSVHPNVMFNMRCEKCQMELPEEHQDIFESLQVYALIVQRVIIPWLRYDLEAQKIDVKDLAVFIDLKRIIENELIGNHVDKISGRHHATSGPRLAHELTTLNIMLPAATAKPVETAHVPVHRHVHNTGGNFGGERCRVTARQLASANVICAMAGDNIEAARDAEKREKKKKKKELKKNKDVWEPLLKRNNFLLKAIAEGKSVFEQNVWREAQNMFKPESFAIGQEPIEADDSEGDDHDGNDETNDGMQAGMNGGDGNEGDENENNDENDLDEVDGAETLGNYGEWGIGAMGGVAGALEIDAIQNASVKSKKLTSLMLHSPKGTLTYPRKLTFKDNDENSEHEIKQHGISLQNTEAWNSTGGFKLDILVVTTKLDMIKKKTKKENIGIQVEPARIRVWWWDIVTKTLYINLKRRPQLVIKRSVVDATVDDPTNGFFRSCFQVVASTGTTEETTAMSHFMQYLCGRNAAWEGCKAESLEDYNSKKKLSWPNDIVQEEKDDEEKEEDDVGEDRSKGMIAKCSKFIQDRVATKLVQRWIDYRDGTGPNYGWYGPWICPYLPRPPKAPTTNDAAAAAPQPIIDHFVTCHREKTGGVYTQHDGSDFTSDTVPGINHETCSCRFTMQPIRLNDGSFATDDERKLILIGMGQPGNDPAVAVNAIGTTRLRRRTNAGRRLDEATRLQHQTGATKIAEDDDDDDGDGVGGLPASPIVRRCFGVNNNQCTKLDSCKDPNVPLGKLCLACSRIAFSNTVDMARKGLWGDDAPPTWWAAALTCRTESKPAIKNVRLYYTCIVLAALEKQQHIQITPPQEEEEEAEEE